MDILKEYNSNSWKTKIINSKNIKLNEKLGSGGTGTVYKSSLNGADIVCKCLYLEDYDDILELFEDINNEMFIYTKLKECVQCYQLIGVSWNEIEETLYIVMKDYGVNGDFHDYVDKTEYWTKYRNDSYNENFYTHNWEKDTWIYHMTRQEKINITLSLCSAIEELHERDIVHCDLKSNNMLYSKGDNNIIIIDFGASQFMNGSKYERISCNWGTVGYTCETLNKGICHKKADIYSLAICILELWCGSIWEDSNDHRGSRLEALKQLRLLEKKEDKLAKVLRGALNTNMDRRPYISTFQRKIKQIF